MVWMVTGAKMLLLFLSHQSFSPHQIGKAANSDFLLLLNRTMARIHHFRVFPLLADAMANMEDIEACTGLLLDIFVLL